MTRSCCQENSLDLNRTEVVEDLVRWLDAVLRERSVDHGSRRRHARCGSPAEKREPERPRGEPRRTRRNPPPLHADTGRRGDRLGPTPRVRGHRRSFAIRLPLRSRRYEADKAAVRNFRLEEKEPLAGRPATGDSAIESMGLDSSLDFG
jgi:hypothetical protein